MTHLRAPCCFALTVAVCCTFVTIAKADERNADEWFQSMVQAQQELNYGGTLSYFDGEEMATFVYSHVVVNGEVHERVTNQNGPPRAFVREGESVFLEVGPDDELLKLRDKIEKEQVSGKFQPRFGRIDDTYSIELNDEDRVAGRNVICISMTPKEADRHVIHLCIDKETSVLLKYDMRNEKDRPIKTWQFSEFETAELNLNKHAMGFANSKMRLDIKAHSQQVDVAEDENLNWTVDWLPKGFERSITRGTESNIGNEEVRHEMYTDGMVKLSVFVESVSEAHEPVETVSGPTIVASHTVQDKKGGFHLVTAIGDMPAKTVWRVARSVTFEP